VHVRVLPERSQCNVYIRIFFQVETVGSVKNINIKNKNINKIFIIKMGGCVVSYCNNSAAKG